MSEARKTYRHRNGKNSWAAKDLIHTFWVGQRVARSSERKAYTDVIAQLAVVTALPSPGSRYLTVELEHGGVDQWSATECIPIRVLVDNNRKRFAAVSKEHAVTLAKLDDNGFQKGTP